MSTLGCGKFIAPQQYCSQHRRHVGPCDEPGRYFTQAELDSAVQAATELGPCGKHLKADWVQPPILYSSVQPPGHCRTCAETKAASLEVSGEWIARCARFRKQDAEKHVYELQAARDGHEKLLIEYMACPDDDVIGDKISRTFKQALYEYVEFVQDQIQAARAAAMAQQREAITHIPHLRRRDESIWKYDVVCFTDCVRCKLEKSLADAPAQEWLEQHDTEQRNLARREQWEFVAGKMGEKYDEHFIFEDVLDRQLAAARLDVLKKFKATLDLGESLNVLDGKTYHDFADVGSNRGEKMLNDMIAQLEAEATV